MSLNTAAFTNNNAYSAVEENTRENSRLKEVTGEYKRVQKNTREYTRIQESIGEYNRVRENTR